MAKKIIWSLRAVNDRKEILSYWKVRNQSKNYIIKLNLLFKKAIKSIAIHPHIGRKTDVEKIRIKLIKDYLIVYEETADAIEILTIWDNRRNPDDLEKVIT
ncbi:MAG: type II toxin-antitoxin system RelE/ParE family toxin [Bacteroidota bacterium]|jgi:toxin YoeB|nr:type II toxin-antitoxin system RelE/ParE family toxin [Flavisolibacter sp.]MDQ3550810.1 type II toxin-antitoxin system RelE/ParE family toxin [Bacteroidota bacterium]